MEYVYLIQEREFVRSGEQTYKIGRTLQADPHNRIKSYPKGSAVFLLCAVENCVLVEKVIIERFTEEFERRNDYGSEYFTGDVDEMKAEIFRIVMVGMLKAKHVEEESEEESVEFEVEESVKLESEDSVEEEDSVDDNDDDLDNIDTPMIEITDIENIAKKTVTRTSSSKKYICKKCGRGFKKVEYLNQHLSRRKTPCGSKFQCTICFHEFTSNRDLDRHLNRKTPCVSEKSPIKKDTPENRCIHCDGTYSTPSSLKRHLKICPNINNVDDLAILVKTMNEMKNEIVNLKKQK